MVNENKSFCYPKPETYKQGVCSAYNKLYFIHQFQIINKLTLK